MLPKSNPACFLFINISLLILQIQIANAKHFYLISFNICTISQVNFFSMDFNSFSCRLKYLKIDLFNQMLSLPLLEFWRENSKFPFPPKFSKAFIKCLVLHWKGTIVSWCFISHLPLPTFAWGACGDVDFIFHTHTALAQPSSHTWNAAAWHMHDNSKIFFIYFHFLLSYFFNHILTFD